jgi:hypothetical protein
MAIISDTLIEKEGNVIVLVDIDVDVDTDVDVKTNFNFNFNINKIVKYQVNNTTLRIIIRY